MGNYRPISILPPVFFKAFEKEPHTGLTNFSTKHNLITASQFGFIKHKSTGADLLVQEGFILLNLEEKKLFLEHSWTS